MKTSNTKGKKKPNDRGKARPSNNGNGRNRNKRNINRDSDNWNGNTIPDTNEFSWYNKYPDLVDAVAKVPFAKRPGMGYGLSAPVFSRYSMESQTREDVPLLPGDSFTIPTLMGIHWIPTIGNSNNNQSPASIAARELYAKVRSAYSGSLDENAPDLLMYVMALDSLFAYLAWMKRIYRTLNSYSPNNKGVPYAILAAEGFSSSQMTSLFENRIKLYGMINQLIYNVSKFTCPDVMDIFKRHYWMSSNIYTDENSKYAQMYMFIPDGFYVFNDSGSSGTQLDYMSKSFSGSDPLPSLWEHGNRMIEALSGSDDAYTMNGHLMRAFEGSRNFTVAPLNEHEVLDFVYDPIVLMQINNAHSPINAQISDVASITQEVSTNAVLQTVYSTFGPESSYHRLTDALLNIPSDNPGVGDVVEATRLLCLLDDEGVITCGTEVVSYFTITKHEANSDLWTNEIVPSIIDVDTLGMSKFMTMLRVWQAFNYAPTMYVLHHVSGDTASTFEPITDIYNITPISREVLDDLHEVCVYSEFNSFDIK